MSLTKKIQMINRSFLKQNRGWFLKILTGQEDSLPSKIGELYLIMTKPGEWRGNHYHPMTSEWFTLFQGEARVILEDPQTHERSELHLLSTEPKTLFVPAGVAHVFINTSATEEMLLAVYAQNAYDPKDTIIYNLVSSDGI